jgi:hypothetical protein
MDRVSETQEVEISCVRSIVLGYEPAAQTHNLWGFFNSGSTGNPGLVPNISINCVVPTEVDRTGAEKLQEVSYEFRCANVRFFNTAAAIVQQPEEMRGEFLFQTPNPNSQT